MAERLKVGDKVIYPAHGAGVIEAIEQKVLSGNEQTVYVMKMLHKGMTILVPLDNVESVGIRNPSLCKGDRGSLRSPEEERSSVHRTCGDVEPAIQAL